MEQITLRRNTPCDLTPLGRMLTDPEHLALVNPNAKHPFDALEWQEKWLHEMDDASFYLLDGAGNEVGFFALRVGVGPEVRHLTYVYVDDAARPRGLNLSLSGGPGRARRRGSGSPARCRTGQRSSTSGSWRRAGGPARLG